MSEDDLTLLKVELIDLVRMLDKETHVSTLFVELAVIHGLDADAIQIVLNQAPYIFCADDVIIRCGLTNYGTVVKIVETFFKYVQ